MGVRSFINEETRDGLNIANRFRKRDFSGNSGRVMKNSFWQIATTLTAKGGSIIFTIVLARLMLPELYGLYGLALSTILFFGVFSDLGITSGMGVYIAKLIDKKPGKAKGYFYYFMRYKFYLLGFSSLLIILLANFLANDYYNKPIFYALFVGAIYLPIQQMINFIAPLFNYRNDFVPQFIKEIILQVSRLILLPLGIIYLLKEMQIDIYLFWTIFILSLCYLFGLIYISGLAKMRHPFKRLKREDLSKEEKIDAWKFIFPLSMTALSGIFFGYIDQIMLGHYVSGAYLGFYQAAFNLISSAAVLIGFGGTAIFPILAKLRGKRLERGFRRGRNLTFLISILAVIATIIISKYLIFIIYGAEYFPAHYYMIPLSFLLISFPLITLYQTYYMSQKRSKIISVLLIGSTAINILLNFVLINVGLIFGPTLGGLIGLGLPAEGMFWGVMGACVATVLSRWIFMVGLIMSRRMRRDISP
jgi:O-antigen/teichoic acid export membrane protein